MFGSVKLIVGVLQIGSYVLVNRASPVTNFDPSRISSLSASGRSYGEASTQNQPSSANGRILSQPSTPDKDAITYPDDIIRDSYGNIVTPYTLLLDDPASVPTSTAKPSNVGLLTDVNRDNGQHLQFAIPSYSDGITEIQGPYKPSLTLLPPLSSGNYNYPSLDMHKPSATVAADNSYQNEVGGSFSSSAQSINPVPTGPTAITTNGHIGVNNNPPSIPSLDLEAPLQSPSVVPNQSNTPTSYEAKTGTSSSSISSFPSVPNNLSPNKAPAPQGSSDFSAIHVKSPDNNGPSSSFSFANTKPLKDTQFVNQTPINIQVDSGKYTGGFGGAPGILGEQKVPGYAVKPSVNKPTLSAPTSQVNNDHPGLNSVHSQSPPNSQNIGTQNALPNGSQQSILPNQNNFQISVAPTTKPNNVNQSGTYGQSNSNHGSFQFGTAFSPNPLPSSQISNTGKYTGGFGGPPGIYSPYDNVKAGKNVATDNNPPSNADPTRKY
ncbi:homeobox protein 5-like isoform X2 [Bradysia coprophila]|uniref:homeobox protein 5-like isoform X2 n=1 Tax=Bradysia coprophila TaxID=38358 RepID=UPI00187D88FF|nr:homeobox protein 5-like isoform X2 [Bradysia coprophila]